MKKSEHKISVAIDVSAEKAWEIVGAVDGVDKWLAPINTCRVEGDKRFCSTDDGAFTEDILKVDDYNRELHYAIPQQNMMPISNILGMMKVRENNDKAIIDWQWEFDVEENTEEQAREMLSGVGQMGIKGIESLILKQ
jgi:Polyketide cyclase / dehydrase and lipid transport